MLLSRAKASLSSENPNPNTEIPTLEEFLEKRDFNGALTLVDFQRQSKAKSADPLLDQWIAYCLFHLGEYKKASEQYKKLISGKKSEPIFTLYLAACYFYMGLYEEAQELAKKSPDSDLKNRIIFHCAHKFNDERQLLSFHNQLNEKTENQLCLAAIHYLRNHNQVKHIHADQDESQKIPEDIGNPDPLTFFSLNFRGCTSILVIPTAIDIYKRLLLENRDYHALNVYIAICYYKIEYQDVASEILSLYLQHFPDSATALNLKACINFKLFDGKVAENDLKTLLNQTSSSFAYARDIIKHNLVVFRNGEDALKVLPPLVSLIPEARLNLIIYHLKHDELEQAMEIAKDIEPYTPAEYVTKAVVLTCVGQKSKSPVRKEQIKKAQQHFQLIGSSSSECDTVSGRQCMASCFFLLRQFEDVLMYLESIKSFFATDDTFNYNYGQAKAATGEYKEALEAFNSITSGTLRQDFTFASWLARCYIMTKQAKLAWEIYLRMDNSTESFNLLQLIADDCYKSGAFYYSAKAFDVLERLDPSGEYWEGKRGACIGAFRDIISGNEKEERLNEIIVLLRSSSHKQSEDIARIMKQYALSRPEI
ncbi:Intraflagellar transport protein 56 [Cichlidogyrus casuarinus]|uniref:Intraflagellar transport protein 56 n=1 Tax=Cichlidogyrus casuarinus TaxID=1844966 RepID=A0ABD2QDE3_9PLAT